MTQNFFKSSSNSAVTPLVKVCTAIRFVYILHFLRGKKKSKLRLQPHFMTINVYVDNKIFRKDWA